MTSKLRSNRKLGCRCSITSKPAPSYADLLGVGRTIGASDVEKYGLTFEGGRVRYEGAPELEDLPESKEATKPEDKAVTQHEDKVMTFGGKPAGEDEPAEGDEEDDSDRNQDELPPPEWTGRTSPEAYLNRYPYGPKAEHARAVIDARDDGADGGS